MEPLFLDTNLIIRFLTRDDPEQAARAYDAFQQAEAGRLTLVSTEGVVVEAVQVLSSKQLYNLPRAVIRDQVTDILQVRGLEVPDRDTLLRALVLYAVTNLDFVDVLILAQMERRGITTVLSFDRGFDRIEGITRREP